MRLQTGWICLALLAISGPAGGLPIDAPVLADTELVYSNGTLLTASPVRAPDTAPQPTDVEPSPQGVLLPTPDQMTSVPDLPLWITSNPEKVADATALVEPRQKKSMNSVVLQDKTIPKEEKPLQDLTPGGPSLAAPVQQQEDVEASDEVHAAGAGARNPPTPATPADPDTAPDARQTAMGDPQRTASGPAPFDGIPARVVVALAIVGGSALLAASQSISPGYVTRRYWFGAMGLFAHIGRRKALAHPSRLKLYRLVYQNPGMCHKELCQSTGLSRTTVGYHMDIMQRHRIISSFKSGQTRRYYTPDASQSEKELALRLNPRKMSVATCILTRPGIPQKRICKVVGIRPNRASEVLRRLREEGLVDQKPVGKMVYYYPTLQLQNLVVLTNL